MPTPPPCPTVISAPPTTTTIAAIEELTTAEPTTEESTTAEPNEPTTEESITTEPVSQPTDPITSNSTPTDVSDFLTPNETINMPTEPIITDEAMMDGSTVGRVPLLIGTVSALLAIGGVITLTVLISVLVCKKLHVTKTFDVNQTSLQLEATNRLHGIIISNKLTIH